MIIDSTFGEWKNEF